MNNLAEIRPPIEIFRIRNSQLNLNQYAEYDLQITNENNSTEMLLENFQLKLSPPYNAHLMIIKELNIFKEIELHIQMKIFTNNFLTSISMMKLFVFISQYDFQI
jgi:hypothetical protein